MRSLFASIKHCICLSLHELQERFLRWIKPLTTSLVLGTFADLTRGKAELLAENALLRQQLIILRRQIKRPMYKKTDRLLLVLLARMVQAWKQALFLVQPETLLRGPRELFRLFWKQKSKVHARKLKLSLVSKRTIQKYMKQARPKRARGQTWKTFLHNHAAEIWACDFLQVTDLFFRPLFAFFIIELKSRKVMHVNVTRSPTDLWVAQQLREATPYGQTPKYLIRDNDKKFGTNFTQVAKTSGIKELRKH